MPQPRATRANGTPASLLRPPAGYADFLTELKGAISASRRRAVASANTALVALYWRIGREILERQAAHGWGAKVIDRLAHDLTVAFPEQRGFSRANLMYMRAFAEAWPDASIVQQVVGQLSWGANLVLLTRLKAADARRFYALHAVQHGWSEHDNPSIGILLVKTKNRVVAEYALRNAQKPIGVAEYQLVHALPAQLEASLPSTEQLENELDARSRPPPSGVRSTQRRRSPKR